MGYTGPPFFGRAGREGRGPTKFDTVYLFSMTSITAYQKAKVPLLNLLQEEAQPQQELGETNRAARSEGTFLWLQVLGYDVAPRI